jgi:hypothetical protein
MRALFTVVYCTELLPLHVSVVKPPPSGGYHMLQLPRASKLYAVSYVTTVTYEKKAKYETAYSLDARGNCSIWQPPDGGGLTTETCRGNINSVQYTIVHSVRICWCVLLMYNMHGVQHIKIML